MFFKYFDLRGISLRAYLLALDSANAGSTSVDKEVETQTPLFRAHPLCPAFFHSCMQSEQCESGELARSERL